ncbi:hypothetical protein Agub_g13771, partial [Astrephomene gubernaculifera]
MGLNHAAKGLDEYGDSSDPMGTFDKAGSRPLCHNAPYLYRLGWSRPINEVPGVGNGEYGNLTAENFTSTTNHLQLTIPAAGTADDSMVVIDLGSLNKEAGA